MSQPFQPFFGFAIPATSFPIGKNDRPSLLHPSCFSANQEGCTYGIQSSGFVVDCGPYHFAHVANRASQPSSQPKEWTEIKNGAKITYRVAPDGSRHAIGYAELK